MMNNNSIQLKGRVLIRFDVVAKTGLHIGGTESGIEIGGVDKTVIRDPLTNRPYIPGSSLRGKMRSLLEKYKGLKQNQRIGQGYIHSCGADKSDTLQTYLNCDVCTTFGVPGERDFATPTRLIVRDVFMNEDSARQLEEAGTDLPYTEVKTEVSIDRVTSAANPRQMERVPAGTRFSGAELVYSIYDGANCDARKDVERLKVIVEGLQLLLDDYLGGLGSRGSGKVDIEEICVEWRGKDYSAKPIELGKFKTVADFAGGLASLQQTILSQL
ncbi:MAG: type III-A CRISPR-associated RAMP protein Csm3 [Anaerolinea sp.]